ncbi:MAG: acyl-CoA dehydrogenase [Chloroflexi bacterium]|nr:acyl-CoA dehydrogenase [Chloroflexota bacterium]
MEFRFSEDDERFRQEVRKFIGKERRPDLPSCIHPETKEEEEYYYEMKRKVGAKGWHSLAWPKEYGGRASVIKQFIVSEEFYFNEILGPDIISDNMVAPTLIQFGSEEQKREFLPKIASGETTWCQGFSEPEAGSDLFALRTQAVKQDDHYIVNGQKVWTTAASLADWMFLLARTESDPALRHRGISAFALDMKSTGVTVRPLRNTGGAFYCEVFFDNVRIPKSNLIGEKNQGARVSFAMLGYERSGIHRIRYAQACLGHLIEYARSAKRNGGTLINDPLVRRKLADVFIEGEAAQLLAYRVLDLQSKGEEVDYFASISRLAGTLFQQHVGEISIETLGQYVQLEPGSKLAPLYGIIERHYLWSLPGTVSAGTAEIQRNIIAERGLKLPRSP